MERTCRQYNSNIRYRVTAMVKASDGEWYISTCNKNFSNNPIHKKTYIKDKEEYFYWASTEDIFNSTIGTV